MIDNGMTEEAMESLTLVNDVYIQINDLDQAISTLTNLKEEEEPETKAYDLENLKFKISMERTQLEKHKILQEIINDGNTFQLFKTFNDKRTQMG